MYQSLWPGNSVRVWSSVNECNVEFKAQCVHAFSKSSIEWHRLAIRIRCDPPGLSFAVGGCSTGHNRGHSCRSVGSGASCRHEHHDQLGLSCGEKNPDQCTHNGAVNLIYDVPLLRNSSNRGLLKSTLGSWEVSGIVTITSGLPINPQLTGGQSNNGLNNATNRPDQVASVGYPQTAAQWFNTEAFALPATGAWGNAGHNSLRGPGRNNWNLSLFNRLVLNDTRGESVRTSRGEFQPVEPH